MQTPFNPLAATRWLLTERVAPALGVAVRQGLQGGSPSAQPGRKAGDVFEHRTGHAGKSLDPAQKNID